MIWGLPWWFSSKISACNAGDLGSISGWGRSLGEGNGNPLQHSCLRNPMGRGAWRAVVQGVTRVEHDSATKPPLLLIYHAVSVSHLQCHFPCPWSPGRVESSLSRLLPLTFPRELPLVCSLSQMTCADHRYLETEPQ